jgi:hypothetical protein
VLKTSVVVDKKISSGFGMLGKRTPPQIHEEEKSSAIDQQSPTKRQATSTSLEAVTMTKTGCQHLDCRTVTLLMKVTCAECSEKTMNAEQCSGCKKYVCSPCQQTIEEHAEENEHEEEQSSLMDLDCQPAGELREGTVEDLEKQPPAAAAGEINAGALKQLEVEQAKATLAKHGIAVAAGTAS